MTDGYFLLTFNIMTIASLEVWMRILLCFVLVLGLPALLFAGTSVGTVKTLSGEAVLVRNGITVQLEIGMPILAADRLQTQADSSLGLILRDDTILSLGPESELLVSDFIFEPKQSRFSMVLKMLKGSFLYMSGVIGKLAPEAIRLETPDSTIAVRGTRLLIKVAP